jgi:hypothetical protein
MSGEEMRKAADRFRAVPLTEVLRLWEARPDRWDKSKWHTPRGTLSVNGSKFINWHCLRGGGGAIDLVIHLMGGCSFREALHWLQVHVGHVVHQWPLEENPQAEPRSAESVLVLPAPDPGRLQHVRSYLLTQRSLPPALLDSLINGGVVYADERGNAVFLLFESGSRESVTVVGAELRGTGSVPWRGMAPGSCKDRGYFFVPTDLGLRGKDRRPIILCESAIDAFSCHALHPGHVCLSTAGARPHPAWLPTLIERGHPLYCGYDADATGDKMAQAMISRHPEVKRLRPTRHDWNALLMSRASYYL